MWSGLSLTPPLRRSVCISISITTSCFSRRSSGLKPMIQRRRSPRISIRSTLHARVLLGDIGGFCCGFRLGDRHLDPEDRAASFGGVHANVAALQRDQMLGDPQAQPCAALAIGGAGRELAELGEQ